MLLRRTPLLLLGEMLASFVVGAFCESLSNSLCYFYLKLSESSQGLPQSFIRGYLGDRPVARYDSISRNMETLVPWMEQMEKETFQVFEWVFGGELEKLSELSNLTEGLHTWQLVLGCELRRDGSKGGFLHYGYDGMDFISFDKETQRWVTAQPQAQKVKQKWEGDPGRSRKVKVFLDKTCIEWLQRYPSYQKKDPLQRTKPPVGEVTHKVVDDRLEVLTCQAFGFYPKEILATWTRDGEICHYETLRRNVVPNSDGTYYVQLSIDIDPKERDRFRCHLEHEGLQEPLVLALKEEPARMWWIRVGIGAAIISGAGILFLIYQGWRFRKNVLLKLSTFPDQVSPENLPSPLVKTRSGHNCSEHNATHGGWRPEGVPEDVVSSGEWKQLLPGAAEALADAATVTSDNALAAAVGGGYVHEYEYHFNSYSGETQLETESELDVLKQEEILQTWFQ